MHIAIIFQLGFDWFIVLMASVTDGRVSCVVGKKSWVVRKVVGKVVGHKMRKKPRFYLKKCFTKIHFYHNSFKNH